jgi:hypothetical protein
LTVVEKQQAEEYFQHKLTLHLEHLMEFQGELSEPAVIIDMDSGGVAQHY